MARPLELILALLPGVLGLVLLPFELLALIDPVGTKMADDGDPFGPPTTPSSEHAVHVVICFVLVGVSWWLIRRYAEPGD